VALDWSLALSRANGNTPNNGALQERRFHSGSSGLFKKDESNNVRDNKIADHCHEEAALTSEARKLPIFESTFIPLTKSGVGNSLHS
jgi:hypothetical protein